MESSPLFTIIGCGRVGVSLAAFLSKAGYRPSGFFSRSAQSAQNACSAAGEGQVFSSAIEAVRASTLVFIATPDLVIEPVCTQIAADKAFRDSHCVFHLSGALSSDILAAARRQGAAAGSIHPLQSFLPYRTGQTSPFSGINISVEGDKDAIAQGRQIIKDLGGRHVTIPTHAKTLYHAAAVVASNYLVTLEHMAVELLKKADLSSKEAFEMLEPLIRGTLENISKQGTIAALTGPVARGDTRVVSSHMEDIEKAIPGCLEFYRMMGRYTLELAQKRGDISPGAVLELESLLKDP